jgi:ribose/xylose/arabinose/galactoside ABC-type transport system permease subunit
MIIGNFSGLQIFSLLAGLYFEYGIPYVKDIIGNYPTTALNVFLIVLLYIMSGGGITVIIGTSLLLIHLHKIGKLIITLGTGTGIFGIVIFILIETTIVNPIESWVDFGFFLLILLMDLYFIGIILVIIARKKMKKLSEGEYVDDSIEDLFSHTNEDIESVADSIKVKCPVCNSKISKNLSFCSHCGTELKYNLEKLL